MRTDLTTYEESLLVNYLLFLPIIESLYDDTLGTFLPDTLQLLMLASLTQNTDLPGALARNKLIQCGLTSYFEPIQIDTEPQTFKPTGYLSRKKESFEIFPNPCIDNLYIRFKNSSEKSIKILNQSGKILFMGYLKKENFTSISVTGFSSGVYILEVIEKGKQAQYKKFVHVQ